MEKRVFIVHGWNGTPNDAWFPWLVDAAGKNGMHAMALFMPNPREPYIDDWVYHLNNAVKSPDPNTFFVGHSIGCQTILRYLSNLENNVKVGGAILVAPWIHLNAAAFDDEEDVGIAQPWLDTPIDWDRVKTHTDKFEAIFSDNDPYVPVADYKIFKEKLGADIVIENGKGHFNTESKTLEMPRVLSALIEMAEE